MIYPALRLAARVVERGTRALPTPESVGFRLPSRCAGLEITVFVTRAGVRLALLWPHASVSWGWRYASSFRIRNLSIF